METMAQAVDASAIFWSLVGNLLNMNNMKLKATPEYKQMEAYVQSDVIIKLHVDVIGDAALIAQLAHFRCLTDTAVAYPYIYFKDVNVLFAAMKDFYARMEHSRADVLHRAIEKMMDHVEVTNIAEIFEEKMSLTA